MLVNSQTGKPRTLNKMDEIDKSLSENACRAWKAQQVLDDDVDFWIEKTWQECMLRHNRAIKMIVHIMGCNADELSYWEHIAYTAGFNAARENKELDTSRDAYLKQQQDQYGKK